MLPGKMLLIISEEMGGMVSRKVLKISARVIMNVM